MYATYLTLLGLAIISNWTVMVVLYRRSQKSITSISLIILLLFVNIWFIPKLFTNAIRAEGLLFETLSRIASLGYIFIPVIFLIFTLSYGRYFKILYLFKFWVLLLIPPIVFLYLSWTTNLVGVHEYSFAKLYPWGFETPTGVLWPLYIFWFDSVILIAVSFLIYHYRRLEDPVKKRQAYYIIHAAVIPLVLDTITIGVLPLFNIFIFPVGIIVLNIMALVGVYAVYKYGFFLVTPQTVLSSINQAIITVDNQGSIIQMNPFSERMLGVKTPNVVGTELEKLLLVQNPQKNESFPFNNLLKPVLDKGKSMSIDSLSVVNRKRQVFPSTISITPIYSQSEIVGANVFLLDITKIREKQKLKDDWFSILSHELKSPITSIKAYNQLLLNQTPENDQKKQILVNMEDQIDRLSRLIQDFFELSRQQTGNLKFEKELISMGDLVKRIVNTMRITYTHRRFLLKSSSNALIYADKDSIEQVLINFITNALKYSDDDKRIEIMVFEEDKCVTVGVKDFGKGIPVKYHKKIFSPFYRIEHAAQGKSGMGIGLFIAGTIIKAHEGRIWVDSVEGQGSTFYFSLPQSKRY
jgi:PAS domain S-box-containing protein